MSHKHEVVMEMLYADGEWFRFPKWVFKIRPNGKKLPAGVAHTLAAILDQSSFQKAAAFTDGWLKFDSAKAEECTGYDERQIERHIQNLIEHGLVQRKRAKEQHGKRLLKVVYPALVEMIGQVAGNHSRQDVVSTPPTHDKMSGEDPTRCRESIIIDADSITDGGSPLQKIISNSKQSSAGRAHLDAAKKLKESLKKHHRVCRGSLEASADGFRLLTEQDQRDYAEVLDWFCLHCSLEDEEKHNLPSIENGGQFRKRYEWIAKKCRKAKPKTHRVYSHTVDECIGFNSAGNRILRSKAVYVDEPIVNDWED